VKGVGAVSGGGPLDADREATDRVSRALHSLVRLAKKMLPKNMLAKSEGEKGGWAGLEGSDTNEPNKNVEFDKKHGQRGPQKGPTQK
jgi:hypothetical protein